MKVVARHQSGHWSEVDDASFIHNVFAMRSPAKKDVKDRAAWPTVVTRTEMTDQVS